MRRDATRSEKSSRRCATGDAITQEKHNNLVSRSRIIRRIPTTSSYKINSFRFRFMFFAVEAKAHARRISYASRSMFRAARFFQQPEHFFFNSNERDCIICAMWNALEFNAFFGAFVFVMLQLFFFFPFLSSRNFHRLFMDFFFLYIFPCKIGDA